MGASHVSAVYAQWSHLPDRPFRLLAYMALIAKDATPEPAYWGGRNGLCIGLGLPASDVSYRIARRAVADLITAGALERVMLGHNGKRSEYRVHVGGPKADTSVPLQADVDNPKGGRVSPPKGGHLSPGRGTPESAKGDTTVPPRTTKNTKSENEEEISPSVCTSPSAREDETTDEISLLEAKRIVREFVDRGGVLVEVLADCEVWGSTARTVWAAAKIRDEYHAEMQRLQEERKAADA